MENKKVASPEQAVRLGVTTFTRNYYNHFLCKLQYLLAIPAFPFIVVCLGYVALFALFIFWMVSR